MNRVSQAEFARLCRVNRSTVSRWLKNGRIEADAAGLIDPEAAERMRAATESPLPHHQARKAQLDEARVTAGAAQGGAAPPDVEESAVETVVDETGAGLDEAGAADQPALVQHNLDLKRSTARLQHNKAELAAMEVDRLAGRLVELVDVQFVLDDMGATVRTLLESFPDRLAGELAAHQGNTNAIHKSLADAARELLLGISDSMQRRMEELAA